MKGKGDLKCQSRDFNLSPTGVHRLTVCATVSTSRVACVQESPLLGRTYDSNTDSPTLNQLSSVDLLRYLIRSRKIACI